jgi:alkylhydroperoxidase family enzyme
VLPTTYPRLHELHPEGAEALAEFAAAAWAGTEPTMLELCRLRVAGMLENEPARRWRSDEARAAGLDSRKADAVDDWERSDLFTPSERAHLAFTEQFVISVSSVTEEQIDALLEHEPPDAVHAFISALYALEMSQRLDMVARATIGREEPK